MDLFDRNKTSNNIVFDSKISTKFHRASGAESDGKFYSTAIGNMVVRKRNKQRWTLKVIPLSIIGIIDTSILENEENILLFHKYNL